MYFHESTAVISRFESYHKQLVITTATVIYSLTAVKRELSQWPHHDKSSINIVIGNIIIIIPK